MPIRFNRKRVILRVAVHAHWMRETARAISAMSISELFSPPQRQRELFGLTSQHYTLEVVPRVVLPPDGVNQVAKEPPDAL